jgi:hypothetical protein
VPGPLDSAALNSVDELPDVVGFVSAGGAGALPSAAGDESDRSPEAGVSAAGGVTAGAVAAALVETTGAGSAGFGGVKPFGVTTLAAGSDSVVDGLPP